MKVVHLSHSDIFGGAARATFRIHEALRRIGVNSRIGVDRQLSDEWTVLGPRNKLDKVLAQIRPAIGAAFMRAMLDTENQIQHSPSLFSSNWPNRVKLLKPDVIHLHWVCGEMLSIPAIGRLLGVVVWTLHDMWAFSGAEHYTEDFRWREGYKRNNRPKHESRLDVNRCVWERKQKYWKRPYHIVTPSRWLGQCVRNSALMHDWPVTVIPNTINTDVWKPVERSLARRLLGLPVDESLVLFGAMGGTQNSIKGFDLLREALRHLRDKRRGLRLAIFGQRAPKDPDELGFPVHYLGRFEDDLSLRVVYSAADVMVIPSRQDNLPNTGVEALACGTPVVAFDTCGLPDIVNHRGTGYLARAFDTEDLAQGIQWVLEDTVRHKILCDAARVYVLERFSYPVIAAQYQELYTKLLS